MPLLFCLSVTFFPFLISQHGETENASVRQIENSQFHNFKDLITRFSLATCSIRLFFLAVLLDPHKQAERKG